MEHLSNACLRKFLWNQFLKIKLFSEPGQDYSDDMSSGENNIYKENEKNV